jgi:hypothetical protein
MMKNPYKWLDSDNERSLFLRKFRNFLGYGGGWTFSQALLDWLLPKLVLILFLAIWFYLAWHIEIILIWK